MDPRQVHDDGDVTVVDVREQDEWDAGHIQGAIHIPMGEITSRVGDFDADTRYVAVCRSGARSGHVAAYLSQQGVDIDNLDGGMQAWARAGLPMVSEGDAQPRVA